MAGDDTSRSRSRRRKRPTYQRYISASGRLTHSADSQPCRFRSLHWRSWALMRKWVSRALQSLRMSRGPAPSAPSRGVGSATVRPKGRYMLVRSPLHRPYKRGYSRTTSHSSGPIRPFAQLERYRVFEWFNAIAAIGTVLALLFAYRALVETRKQIIIAQRAVQPAITVVPRQWGPVREGFGAGPQRYDTELRIRMTGGADEVESLEFTSILFSVEGQERDSFYLVRFFEWWRSTEPGENEIIRLEAQPKTLVKAWQDRRLNRLHVVTMLSVLYKDVLEESKVRSFIVQDGDVLDDAIDLLGISERQKCDGFFLAEELPDVISEPDEDHKLLSHSHGTTGFSLDQLLRYAYKMKATELVFRGYAVESKWLSRTSGNRSQMAWSG